MNQTLSIVILLLLSRSRTMDNHPVNSIGIVSHNHDDVDDNSTLSSKTISKKIIVIKPPKILKVYLNLKKHMSWEKTPKPQTSRKEKNETQNGYEYAFEKYADKNIKSNLMLTTR